MSRSKESENSLKLIASDSSSNTSYRLLAEEYAKKDQKLSSTTHINVFPNASISAYIFAGVELFVVEARNALLKTCLSHSGEMNSERKRRAA